jgi:hypothetical protein
VIIKEHENLEFESLVIEMEKIHEIGIDLEYPSI